MFPPRGWSSHAPTCLPGAYDKDYDPKTAAAVQLRGLLDGACRVETQAPFSFKRIREMVGFEVQSGSRDREDKKAQTLAGATDSGDSWVAFVHTGDAAAQLRTQPQ